MKRSAAHNGLDVEAFKERLKELGFKATPQRIAIHNAMLDLVHASADMVAEYIEKKGTVRVTVASVYNTLSGMADLGIYARRFSPGNKMWFDVKTFKHLHAYDKESGTFIDIFNDELVKNLEDKLKRLRLKGYRLEKADIQIVCRPSRKAKK